MNCSLCDKPAGTGERCQNCGARLDVNLHLRVAKIDFALMKLRDWNRSGHIFDVQHRRLSAELTDERVAIAKSLLPVPAPKPPTVVILEELPPPPVVVSPPPAPKPIAHVPPPAPPPPPKPVVYYPPAPPPVPPRSFAEVLRDLGSERNIRWLLNIGIFLFTLALAVFIWTKWDRMGSHLRLSILFGGTIAAVVLGHVLRGIIADVTAHALTVLGTIALPLDFLALTKFPALAAYGNDVIGLSASFACLVTYSQLGRLYRERAFSYLAMLALTGMWGFGLDVAGVGWGRILTTLPPAFTVLYLIYIAVVRREGLSDDARKLWLEPTFVFLHFAVVGATSAILVALLTDLLTIRGDMAPLAIAALGGFLFHAVAARRLDQPAIAWGAALYLMAACAELVYGGGRTVPDSGLPWVFIGLALLTPFGVSTGRFVQPVLAGGLLSLFSGLLILAHFGLYRDMTVAFIACGAFGVAATFVRREAWLLVPGYGCFVAAIVLDALRLGLPPADLSLHLAIFAAVAGLAAATRRKLVVDASFWFAFLTAAAATLLFATDIMNLWYRSPARGALICALCGVAMAGVLRVQPRRFLADLFYLCVTGAYVMGLQASGFNADWMGVAVALLAAAFFAAARTGRFLVPTMFLTLAISTSCVIYAAVLYLTGLPLEASCTGAVVALVLGIAAVKTDVKLLAHPAVYLATLSLAAFLEWRGVPGASIALFALAPAAAAVALGGHFASAGFVAAAVTGVAASIAGVPHRFLAPTLALLTLARPRVALALLPSLAGLACASALYETGRVVDAGVALLSLSTAFATSGVLTELKVLLYPAVFSVGLGTMALLEAAHLRPHEISIAMLLPAAILLALARIRKLEGVHIEAATFIGLTLLTLVQSTERFERSAVAYYGLGLAAILVTHAFGVFQPLRLAPAAALVVLAANLGAFVSSPGLSAALFAALALYALIESRHVEPCGAAAVAFACASVWHLAARAHAPMDAVGLWIAPVPVVAGLLAHALKRPWILGASTMAAVGLMAGWMSRPETWTVPHQFPTAAMGALFAAASLVVAYRRPWVHASIPTALGATFVMLAYLVGLDGLSRGLRWDGLVVLSGAFAMTLWAYAHERRGFRDHARPILAVAFVLSVIALAVALRDKPNFDTVRPYAFFAAAALYLGVALGWRMAPVTVLAAVAVAVGDLFLISLHGYHNVWTSVYLMPSALVLLSVAYGLQRRLGADYAGAFVVAGSTIAGVATLMAAAPLGDFGYAWPLTICLAVDAGVCAFAGLAVRRPGLMYAASLFLYFATASMLRAAGVAPAHAALILVASATATVAAAARLPEPAQTYAKPFAVIGLVLGVLPVLGGAATSDFYLERDTLWGIVTLLATGALYAVGARVYRQPYLALLAAVSAFGAYALTLHHLRLYDPEYYAAPVGLGLLIWSGSRSRGPLGLAAVGLIVLPSMTRSFDVPGDPQALAAILLAVATIFAGMILRRRIALVGGTAAVVAEACGKAVQFMIASNQPWEVWGMVIGGVLFLLGTTVELTRRRVVDGTAARWRQSARAYFADWGW